MRCLQRTAVLGAMLTLLPGLAGAQEHCGNSDPDDPKAYTSPPILADLQAFVRAISDEYPRALRRRGVSGRSEVAFFIDTLGVVRRALVEVSAGNAELDSAAVRVALKAKFFPAILDRRPICKWVRFPIVFRPTDTPVGRRSPLYRRRSR